MKREKSKNKTRQLVVEVVSVNTNNIAWFDLFRSYFWTMEKLTPQQRYQIVEIYFTNGKSVNRTWQALADIYGKDCRPSKQTIHHTIKKLRTTYTLLDAKPISRQKTVRSDENIAAVKESLTESPNLSIRQRAQQLGISPSTIRKILCEDLGISAVQERSFIPNTSTNSTSTIDESNVQITNNAN